MAFEQYANSAKTTLNGAINNSTTTVIINSATGFPTSGNFRILVEAEIMLVTAVSGNTFTVTRGVESTTGASHADGLNVTHILTSASLKALFAQFNQYGPIANIPAAGNAGAVYTCSDSPLTARDNGSTWDYFAYGCPVTPPSNSGWTWGNQGTATVTAAQGGLYIEDPTQYSAETIRFYYKSVPAIPYTCIMAFVPCYQPQGNFPQVGIMITDNTPSHLKGQTMTVRSGNPYFSIYHWTAYSTFSTTPLAAQSPVGYTPTLVWLKLVNLGSGGSPAKRIYYYSPNGINWMQYYVENYNADLVETRIGIYTENINNNLGAGYNSGGHILHWDLH